MIGIVLNSDQATTQEIQITANKLLLVSNTVVIVSQNKDLKNTLKKQKNLIIIPQQQPFEKDNCLSEIYAVSSKFSDQTDYLTLSTNYSQVKTTVLTNLSNNSNCYTATINKSYYTISHFNIDNYDLSQYLSLDDFSLEKFITQEIQCLPLSFSSGDMF